MTKKVDTWMPLLVDKYLGDTTHLNTEQHGAYLLLLMAMWKKDGTLSNRDEGLASITRMTPAKWKAAKPVLMEFFTATDDGAGITQKRLTEELIRSKAMADKKAEAGSKGAAKRWQKDGSAISKLMADAWQSHKQTGAPISISTPPPSGGKENALAFSASSRVGFALMAGGIAPESFNVEDPRLKALIEQGATPEEFEGIAREAAGKPNVGNPFAWLLVTLPDRRRQAAEVQFAKVPAAPINRDADRTAEYLREQAERAAEAPSAEVLEKLKKLRIA